MSRHLGNLTGNKRIVKDACIDLYNAVQKWISLTSDSHSLILPICMLRQEELSVEKYLNEDVLNDATFAVNPEMLRLCAELKKKWKNLESVADKIGKVSRKFKSICDLSELESSHYRSISESFGDSNTDPILFQTWPLSKFYEASEDIEKMHFKELQNKLKIIEEVAIAIDKSELTFIESCWKYEPYINRARVNELLESILFELELS